MEKFVKGDIVVVRFPFSDLTSSKRRPALVLTVPFGEDLVLCQITSKATSDIYCIPLSEKEFKNGSLKQESNIRPNKIFTAEHSIIEYKVGTLQEAKTKQAIEKVCQILRG